MSHKTSTVLAHVLLLSALIAIASAATCDPVIAGCSDCDANGTCVTCASVGQRPNAEGTACVDCNYPDCEYCAASNACTRCSSGYSMGPNNQSCIQCN